MPCQLEPNLVASGADEQPFLIFSRASLATTSTSFRHSEATLQEAQNPTMPPAAQLLSKMTFTRFRSAQEPFAGSFSAQKPQGRSNACIGRRRRRLRRLQRINIFDSSIKRVFFQDLKDLKEFDGNTIGNTEAEGQT